MVMNICAEYTDKAAIYILTQNIDMGETTPYDLPTNVWLDKYGVKIMYVSPETYGRQLFRCMYSEFDTIYSCGLFCNNSYEMMTIHRFAHKPSKTLYIAPMGVFSEGAISNKQAKKKLFISVCKVLGLDKNIIWSFTSEGEKAEAEKAFGKSISNYVVAEDLPRKPANPICFEGYRKRAGTLKIIFLSRLSPKKNLKQAIKILLKNITGHVIFDIYGTMEDEKYWQECEREIKKLPNNIEAKYRGAVRTEDVVSTFENYDVFLFPTKGENFGHVIYESLLAGCVPVISDTTPWQDFGSNGCGAVIELNDEVRFREFLQQYIDMDTEEFKTMKLNARNYAENKYEASVRDSGYNRIFIEGPGENRGSPAKPGDK